MSLENILWQEIVQKLGWTLLHFVWQATAVALLAAILLAGLRKAAANVRYIIACTALCLMVLLPLVTIPFVPLSTPQPMASIEPPPASAIAPAQPAEAMPSDAVVEYEASVRPESSSTPIKIPWKQRVAERLEPALPYLVAGWLLGVFGLSLWHLGGWAQLQRLRRKLIKPVDASLHVALKHLADKLGVDRAVELLESALVQVPTVVGWLRPVILLPASALTGLSAEQLEALLAHELAHVRRCDYLVNVLQTVVETLGFYHPAVWWVSHKIRIERENCCDDLAVNICGDRLRYARALTSMEEIRSGRAELAVAASGGNLFAHIRRLVANDATDSRRTSWIPSVVTILLIGIIAIPTTLALTAKSEPQQTHEAVEPQDQAAADVDNVKAGLQADMPAANDMELGVSKSSEGIGIPAADEGWVEWLAVSKTDAKESAERLMGIGRAMLAYAKDHDGKYPLSAKLYELREYLNTEEYAWTRQYEYMADGKTTSDRADIVIYYDAQLFEQGKGTNVLFNDGHVEFIGPKRLNELNINKTQILLETRILYATDDFLKENQLDANSVRTREIRSVYSTAESATEPNSLPYCLILDVPDVNQRFKARYTPKGQQTRILTAPQALTLDGRPVKLEMHRKFAIFTPSDANNLSDKAESKPQYVDVGTSIKIVADVLPDSNNVLLDCEWEHSQVRDFEERVGPDGKKYKFPLVAHDNMRISCTVPDGKTLLIGGKKIHRWAVTQTKKPLLGDLPLIGPLFRSESKAEETRNVLILVKPTVIAAAEG